VASKAKQSAVGNTRESEYRSLGLLLICKLIYNAKGYWNFIYLLLLLLDVAAAVL